MTIDSSRASGARASTSSAADSRDTRSQPAPAHVDTLRWSLADADERRQLATGAPGGQPQEPTSAPQPDTAAPPSPSPTLGAVAGARAIDRLKTTPQGLTDRQFEGVARTVRDEAQKRKLGTDIVVQGSRAARTARPTSDLDLGIRVSPERFDSFLNSKQSRLGSPNPGSALADTRDMAIAQGRIHAGEARLSTTAKALAQDILPAQPNVKERVDLSVIKRGGPFDTSPTMDVPAARTATTRAAGHGALVGGAVQGGFSAAHALRDGRVTGAEAHDVLAQSAQGATVGATYAVTERGLIRAADRLAGSAIERGLGTGARIAGTRLAGAGVAGAAITAGMSIYDNRDGLARGDSKAIGRVAGDVAVGGGSALAGAAAGAAIGSVVPGVGTAIGAVVGLGAGYLADQALRAGGVDKMIGNAVAGAADKVKSWFSW